MDFLRVQERDITVGAPLSKSVYNSSGELLLKQGQMITTSRQQHILVEHGYIQSTGSTVRLTVKNSRHIYVPREKH